MFRLLTQSGRRGVVLDRGTETILWKAGRAGHPPNSNIGGMYSATFTAHIDSAWADNPVDALLHLFIDVLGHNSRNPCPQ